MKTLSRRYILNSPMVYIWDYFNMVVMLLCEPFISCSLFGNFNSLSMDVEIKFFRKLYFVFEQYNDSPIVLPCRNYQSISASVC